MSSPQSNPVPTIIPRPERASSRASTPTLAPAPTTNTTTSTTTTTTTTSTIITLQVGERRFTTRPATLALGSSYFASLLSGRWPPSVQPDGSHFIDADGDVFAHVLRYLRHETLPIFYDEVRGHEHAAYVAVLGQARYFGVEPLRVWLEGRKYLAAVKVKRVARVVEAVGHLDGSTGGGVGIEHHVAWRTKKVYVCPRDIWLHRDNRAACGRLCRNARGDADDEYVDEDVLKVLEVQKVTSLDPEMCVE